MSATEGDPTLDDLLDVAAGDAIEEYHGPLPVIVVEYTAAQQTVDVRSLVRVKVGAELLEVSQMRDVPVLFAATASHSVVLPIAAGDIGWVFPAGADIGPWHARGTDNAVDAEHRRFDLSDAVFVPGSRPLTSALAASAYHSAWAVLAGEWLVGSSAATKAVALASDVVSELQAIRDFFDSHIHGTPAGNSTAPTVLFAAGAPVADCAATKLKAE